MFIEDLDVGATGIEKLCTMPSANSAVALIGRALVKKVPRGRLLCLAAVL
jgi:hypothetical protein